MGGFHITICMLHTIYCIYSKIGFVQILAKAVLGGVGSLKITLKGGDVKEEMRLHKTLFEALVRTKSGYFDIKLSDENSLKLEVYKEDINPDSSRTIISQEILPKIPAAEGVMGWFIGLYIELVNMLLNFIHFVRTGNWEEEYLEVIFEFLPFCFRLNRHNYARNPSYYYAQIIALPFTNAQAHEYLTNGGLNGSLTGTPHTKIPYDQIIETTINRQCKDVDSIEGNRENLGTTERWARNSHLIAVLCKRTNKKIRKKTKQKYVDLGKPIMQRDERDVSNVKDCIETWLPSLWHPEQEITNIFSGCKATIERRN